MDTEAEPRPITDEDVQRVALAVVVSPISIIRTLAGLPVRGQAGERARIGVAMLWEGEE